MALLVVAVVVVVVAVVVVVVVVVLVGWFVAAATGYRHPTRSIMREFLSLSREFNTAIEGQRRVGILSLLSPSPTASGSLMDRLRSILIREKGRHQTPEEYKQQLLLLLRSL